MKQYIIYRIIIKLIFNVKILLLLIDRGGGGGLSNLKWYMNCLKMSQLWEYITNKVGKFGATIFVDMHNLQQITIGF